MRRRRLYFLLPDTKQARSIFKELLLARVEERHIHVMAKEGIALRDLPEATLLQKSDVKHGAGLGLILGGVTGALAGVVVMWFPPSGLAMGLGIVLAMSVLGAVMGTWAAGMIASSVPNTHLAPFFDEVDKGKILMIVDVPKRQADDISSMIKRHHPEADMRGLDPTIPSFP